MSSGTYTPSSLCISTGMPLPSLKTRTTPSAASMSTLSVTIVGSRTLLSVAFTRISSKILYRPGTKLIWRCTSLSMALSYTQARASVFSHDPTYVSGRSRMCSSCVFFW